MGDDLPDLEPYEQLIERWLARQLETNPLALAVDRDPDVTRWYLRLRGEERDFTTIWITLGQRTLQYETLEVLGIFLEYGGDFPYGLIPFAPEEIDRPELHPNVGGIRGQFLGLQQIPERLRQLPYQNGRCGELNCPASDKPLGQRLRSVAPQQLCPALMLCGSAPQLCKGRSVNERRSHVGRCS